MTKSQLIALVVIILAIVGGGSYLAFDHFLGQNEPNEPTKIVENDQLNTGNDVVDQPSISNNAGGSVRVPIDTAYLRPRNISVEMPPGIEMVEQAALLNAHIRVLVTAGNTAQGNICAPPVGTPLTLGPDIEKVSELITTSGRETRELMAENANRILEGQQNSTTLITGAIQTASEQQTAAQTENSRLLGNLVTILSERLPDPNALAPGQHTPVIIHENGN